MASIDKVTERLQRIERERDALRAKLAALVEAMRELVADVQPPALAAEGQIRAPKRKTLENAKATIAAAESEADASA